MLDEEVMLEIVRKALRIRTNDFDSELALLIEAAQIDMGIAGVTLPTELDSVVKMAIITYVKMNFGEPDEYDRLKAAYDEQKAQLSMATGYTTWTEA